MRIFTTLFCLFLIYGCGVRNIRKNSQDSWNLVWQDNFEYNGKPDDKKWSHSPKGGADWARYCTDSDSTRFVKNGNLHLRGILNTNPADTLKYSTGCISTKNKFSFNHGRIEVRAKLDKGKGSWPAIWMMPQDSKYGGWPHSGEIDIMEHLNRDTIVYQTLHSNYIDIQEKREDPLYFTTVPFKIGEYNNYGVEWYPDRLDFFVNGKHTFSYPKIQDADARQWPFDQEFFILLNQALGGSWVGKIADEDLPVEMLVDWVRVYQKN
ncbi:glycoside hydrolase family 16 protein [Salinimicrobium tongyeongense]|uniref:Glycoside hydrolase family 16 protein n=1 Tax=Salinimicrobium tongyeongense TaxID=2809707 RepID=A0ABY6NR86_9FLAO|nr:glycoside hydrolase family 16 protein [Salinimicrobium tongyeongense]UZH55430.1 glycoside hydrolase family 16 protein [Salinimicrobium tongyeongense]